MNTSKQLPVTTTLGTARRARARWLRLLTFAVLTGPVSVRAQSKIQVSPSRMGAHEVLTRLERGDHTGKRSASSIVREPEKYPRARVDSVIEGLERLALRSKSGMVRSEAAATLTMAGAANSPIPGVFERTLGVYHRSSDNLARGMIISFMYHQRDRARAISFLKSVAAQDSAHADYPEAPFRAAQTLSEMGPDGRSALAKLHRTGALRDSRTLGFADWYFRTK